MPGRTVVCCLLMAVCLVGCRPKRKTDEEKSPRPPVEPLTPTPPAENLDTPAGDTPDTFKVRFECSHGDFVVRVHRKWAPKGAARFYDLVKAGFFDGCRFFRVVPGFVVQWGINGDPKIQARWRDRNIPDDPMRDISNKRGTITFANSGPGTRTAQVFINFKDNPGLDAQRTFPPFGEVIEGMNVVDAVYAGYGQNPDQAQIQSSGNKYLNREFPKLDYIKKATLIEPEKKKPDTGKTKAPEKTQAAKKTEKTPAQKTRAEKTKTDKTNAAKTPAKTN